MAVGLLTAILLLGAVDGVGNLAGDVAARTAAHHTVRARGEAALACAHVAGAAGIALGVDERKLEQAEGRRDQQHAQRHGTGIDGRVHGEHWKLLRSLARHAVKQSSNEESAISRSHCETVAACMCAGDAGASNSRTKAHVRQPLTRRCGKTVPRTAQSQ